MEQSNQLVSLKLTEMPNQEEFKKLAVEPEDICPQSSEWEESKRFKLYHSGSQSMKHPIEGSSEQQICLKEKAATEPAHPDDQIASGKRQSLDDECEVITFIIGAASLSDTISMPMPPPSRFIRKQDRA
jgi:hypothetical protein